MLLTKKQRNRPKTIPRPPTGGGVISYNSDCTEDMWQTLAPYQGVFRVGQFNGVVENYRRPAVVDMATKKWIFLNGKTTITRRV